MVTTMTTDIVLQNVVVRYPHLAEMWTGNPSYAADYQIQVILPRDFAQWTELQAAANEALTSKFGASMPQNIKMPWLNKMLQPNVQKDGPYEGCYFFTARGKQTKPAVVDAQVQPIPDLQIKQMVFSGCICNVYVNLAAYGPADPGIGVYLKSVQLINNQVEPIADAGPDPATVFQVIPGAPAPIAPAQAAPAPFSPQDPLVKPPQGGNPGW